ncbi:hypothetical protein FE393_17135 [Xenorhabdus sp. psl]|nr:hypothetical protein [Xenorhabdus sp. psl]
MSLFFTPFILRLFHWRYLHACHFWRWWPRRADALVNVKVLPETVDDLLCVVPAVVDMDYCFDQFVVNVHHLAMFLSHCLPPYARHGMTTN